MERSTFTVDRRGLSLGKRERSRFISTGDDLA
jgi:hypothetical protein